ncbi:uncharacterized protein LOC115304751 [Suricata suricatta]|uniref:uncharacterized protein LOC115304751 n=1 Tax=Suricata suricatta TaxID=37032 RepID=UPI0011560184|nr:uncharacterized protein LOC115304751 [Suricata suricatta]
MQRPGSAPPRGPAVPYGQAGVSGGGAARCGTARAGPGRAPRLAISVPQPSRSRPALRRVAGDGTALPAAVRAREGGKRLGPRTDTRGSPGACAAWAPQRSAGCVGARSSGKGRAVDLRVPGSPSGSGRLLRTDATPPRAAPWKWDGSWPSGHSPRPHCPGLTRASHHLVLQRTPKLTRLPVHALRCGSHRDRARHSADGRRPRSGAQMAASVRDGLPHDDSLPAWPLQEMPLGNTVATPVQMGLTGPLYSFPSATLRCWSFPPSVSPPFLPLWLVAFSRRLSRSPPPLTPFPAVLLPLREVPLDATKPVPASDGWSFGVR